MQMIIWRDRPLANDNLEGLASYVQMIIHHPRHPNHLSQDLDSISRTFLEQFALVEQDFRRVLKMWMAVSGWWWCRCRNYSFPVGGAVVHHHHGHGARLHSATRSTFSPHRQLRRATAGRTGSDEISTENFLYFSFFVAERVGHGGNARLCSVG